MAWVLAGGAFTAGPMAGRAQGGRAVCWLWTVVRVVPAALAGGVSSSAGVEGVLAGRVGPGLVVEAEAPVGSGGGRLWVVSRWCRLGPVGL